MASTLTKTEIKDMIKSQIDKSVDELIAKRVKEALGDKATEKKVNQLIINSMVRFYKLLWLRSSVWAKDLK